MSLDCGEETRGYILDINGYNVTILEKKKERKRYFVLLGTEFKGHTFYCEWLQGDIIKSSRLGHGLHQISLKMYSLRSTNIMSKLDLILNVSSVETHKKNYKKVALFWPE